MKVGVCLKQVPDTDTRIRVNATGNGIDASEVKWIINPYDEFALELALKLKDAKKASEVVIFTIGEVQVEQRIRDGLARGADRAVRLEDAAFAGSDALGRARILAAAVQGEGIQLVLCGRAAIDGDQGATAGMMAEVLGWRQASWIEKLDVEADVFVATRAADGGTKEVVKGALPAVLTVDKLEKDPRTATLPGIMAAKRKPIVVKNAAALGLSADSVGAGAALVVEESMGLPPARPAGRMLSGAPAQVAAELVRLLRDEAKVI